MARCGGRTRGMKRLGGPWAWRERVGRVWLDGCAGDLRIHCGLRAGVRGASAILAPTRRVSSGSPGHSLAGIHGHAAGAHRQSLSGSRRTLREAAVHLPRLLMRGVALVSPAKAQQGSEADAKLSYRIRFRRRWKFSEVPGFPQEVKNKSAEIKFFITIPT